MTVRTSFKSRLIAALSILFLVASIAIANAANYGPNNSHVQVSNNPDRSNSVELTNQILKGKVYIFVKTADVDHVFFYLDTKVSDDQLSSKNATKREYVAPFDLRGTLSNGNGQSLDTKKLTDGSHILKVIIVWNGGYESLKIVNFTVQNNVVTPTTTIAPTTLPATTTTVLPTTTTIAPSTTTTTIKPVTSGIDLAGFTTVWNDEFDGSSLNTSKWYAQTGTVSYDRSCFTKENVTVGSGLLDIRTSQNGTCGKPYSSGYIRNSSLSNMLVSPTQSKSGVLRIEMRAQMPKWQKGIWPGLWTRNATQAPMYGEIDLIEQWGNEASAAVVVSTSHFGDVGNHKGKSINAGTPLDQGMHTYATEININNGGSVSYFIDNQLIVTHKASDFSTVDFLGMLKGKWDARIMVQNTGDQQAYAGGGRNDSVKLVDTHLKVDWVRYYLKN